MIRCHDLGHFFSNMLIIGIRSLHQRLHLLQKYVCFKRNRTSHMNQTVRCLLQPFLRHELLFIELLTRAETSSCQDRNNFFLKKICNTINYRITRKNGAKKELLFSQKPFHINYLLFYNFLKNLPIQQIILFSYTLKNQFLGSHIKFYRLYSLIRIIT